MVSEKLSVIVISRNEERDLPDCLASIKDVASEIIVVDSGSSDKTIEIAKNFGAKVHHKEFTGFSDQKSFALDKAEGPWVLNLDADERLSNELRSEVQSILNENNSVSGYDIPFHNYFLGTRLKFGAGCKETHVRLFKKQFAHYEKRQVHEGIAVEGAIERCRYPILHYSYHSIKDYLEKCNKYTTLIAEKKFSEGHRFQMFHHLRLPYEFIVRYFLKLGFLDGEKGLTYATLSAYYVWLKYRKMKDFETK